MNLGISLRVVGVLPDQQYPEIWLEPVDCALHGKLIYRVSSTLALHFHQGQVVHATIEVPAIMPHRSHE